MAPGSLTRSDASSPASQPLKGNLALVTGAGRGIGRAIALALGSAGANVACIARTEHELKSVADEINNASSRASSAGKAIPFVYDVTNIAGIPGLVSDIQARFGVEEGIDILVNNAGIARIDALLESGLDMEVWQRVLATNLTAPVAFINAVLPDMVYWASGFIISIGSRCAALDVPYNTAYSVAKTGLLKFHQCLEAEIGESGVVNYYLQPGNVDTGILQRPGAVDSSGHKEVTSVVRTVEYRDKIKPEVVAKVCLRLLVDPRATCLSGMYVDMNGDIDAVVDDIKAEEERGERGECVRRELYRLKIDELD